MTTDTVATEAVFKRHSEAFMNMGKTGVEPVIADYSEDAVLITPTGVISGRDALREYFANIATELPAGIMDTMQMGVTEIRGEIVYITWSALPGIPMGSDTFVIRHGKIVAQTVVMYMPQV